MDMIERNVQIALCAAWQCHVRRNCRRYVEFDALRPGEGAGHSYVAASGRLGKQCHVYQPMDSVSILSRNKQQI